MVGMMYCKGSGGKQLWPIAMYYPHNQSLEQDLNPRPTKYEAAVLTT
jgi:hypothetical protein